jgi:hypothetical protein
MGERRRPDRRGRVRDRAPDTVAGDVADEACTCMGQGLCRPASRRSQQRGIQYFGPTLWVGPTVLLPIAASFAAWRGLLQARGDGGVPRRSSCSFTPGRRLAGPSSACCLRRGDRDGAVGHRIRSAGGLRVPAGMLSGAVVVEACRYAPSWPRLIAAGVVLGLGTMTKHVVAGLGPRCHRVGLDRAYYRNPSRVFVVPLVRAHVRDVEVAVLG